METPWFMACCLPSCLKAVLFKVLALVSLATTAAGGYKHGREKFGGSSLNFVPKVASTPQGSLHINNPSITIDYQPTYFQLQVPTMLSVHSTTFRISPWRSMVKYASGLYSSRIDHSKVTSSCSIQCKF